MKKTYVITGSTSGIGLALVEYFSSQGNTVFAGYRDTEKLNKLPNEVIPFYIDANDDNSIIEAANLIKLKTDKIDTLINVAGCVVAGAIEKIPVEELRRQFDVNVFSHLLFTQNLLEILDNGRIINMSSMSSYGFFPFISPYGASKRTLDILFQALANETKHKVKVISIKPGVIATPLWDKSIRENENTLTACSGYDNEIKYMKANAQNNGKTGLNVNEVVKVVSKADKSTNPKSTYTVGTDACFARTCSILPEAIVNKFVKIKLKGMK